MIYTALGVAINQGANGILNILGLKGVLAFVLFITFYIPCMSTIVVLLREFGAKVTLISIFAGISVGTLLAVLVRLLPI